MAVAKSAAAGPKSADPVDMVTGYETNTPDPDLTVYSPNGPDVVWQRHFVTLQSYLREGSPGFSNGWMHGYDVRVESTPPQPGVAWPDVTLIFPNGASVSVTPIMAAGVPTGAFSHPSGKPFIVTGVADVAGNKWTNIYVTWANGAKWRFEMFRRLERDIYDLATLYNATGQSISFNWDSDRRLTSVEADDASSTVLLTLTYDSDGLVQKATDLYGRAVWYTHAIPANSPQTLPVANTPLTAKCLTGVSQIGLASGAEPAKRWIYGYAGFYDRPTLYTIAVPDPDGTSTTGMVLYNDASGRVYRLRDANLNSVRFDYSVPGETRVRYTNSSDVMLYQWYQKFDSAGRNTGKRNSSGDETFIQYLDANNPYSPTNVTDAEGRTTVYTYDSYGNRLTSVSPRGVTVTNTYTYTAWPMGRLTSIQQSTVSGGVTVTKPATTIGYAEPSGLATSVTQPNPSGSSSHTTSYQYDSYGDLTRITAPTRYSAGNYFTVLNYTTDGAYTQAQKRGQPVTASHSNTLDGSGNPTAPMQTWHLRYDSRGNNNQVTDTLGRQTDATYDIAGDVTRVDLPPTGQTGAGRGSITNVYQYPGGPQSSAQVRDEGASGGTLIREADYTYGHEGEFLTVTGSHGAGGLYL